MLPPGLSGVRPARNIGRINCSIMRCSLQPRGSHHLLEEMLWSSKYRLQFFTSVHLIPRAQLDLPPPAAARYVRKVWSCSCLFLSSQRGEPERAAPRRTRGILGSSRGLEDKGGASQGGGGGDEFLPPRMRQTGCH